LFGGIIMKIKSPEISIPKDNPFAEDVLNRRESAEILTQFLKMIKEPFVLAIDSSWGTGKTTFLKMWIELLKSGNTSCIYFNAWENDFAEDPLISLLGEINIALKYLNFDDDRRPDIKAYLSDAKKLGSAIIKRSTHGIIKHTTAGIIDTDDIKEHAFKNQQAESIKDRFDQYETDKEIYRKFKDNMELIIKELSITGKNEKIKPLIFFIDELDRCRPSFAIKLLERAKHLFSIEGIIFVLALDKNQIGHSIKSFYGQGMDADGYLRRFIDVTYHLPDPSNDLFCEALFNRFGIKEYYEERLQENGKDDGLEFFSIFSKLSTLFGFSLRIQEQCFSLLSIVLSTIPPEKQTVPSFLGLLIALRESNKELYKNYINGIKTGDEVMEYIRKLPEGERFMKEKDGMKIEACLATNWESEYNHSKSSRKYINKINDENTPDEEKRRATYILKYMGTLSTHDGYYNCMQYLSKKIEISENFTK